MVYPFFVRKIAACAAFAAGLIVLTPLVAFSQTFSFTNYVDDTTTNGGAFDIFFSSPSVNASGTVAFLAVRDDERFGIYTSAGDGTAATVADEPAINGTTFEAFTLAPPAINASGTVAFGATFIGGSRGIFSATGGILTNIANETTTNGGALEFISSEPSINDSGTVAFVSTIRGGGSGIFAGSGGNTVVTIADDTTTNGGVFGTTLGGVFGSPTINASGTVAFVGALDSGGQGVFTATGDGTAVTIADSLTTNNGELFGFGFSTPSLNAGGTVAFLASLDAGGDALFTGSGGAIRTIADETTTNGGAFNFFDAPSINAGGTIAFYASLDNGGEGLFALLPGESELIRIVSFGDALFGSTLTGISFSRFGLNDSNLLAFGYDLEDGRQGIATVNIAAPVVVPEAGALALMLPVLGVLVATITRRRKK